MPTISLTFDASNATRIATAFGALLGLGRDATQAEVKAYLVTHMRDVVRERERQAAIAALGAPSNLEVT